MEGMLPADTDVDPAMLIGEFPFGAMDRGSFWYGLESARDQAARAIAFRESYFDALGNRYIVGAHWFSFAPQPITGRKDGGVAQIGLVDIADNPYSETVHAAREVGEGIRASELCPKVEESRVGEWGAGPVFDLAPGN
ncbi:MAG: hypothetical protein MI807_11150 [Verrucomicrobiales bacterium]|nr:hypothetical protein [Verrucomicrobiales bacterium]